VITAPAHLHTVAAHLPAVIDGDDEGFAILMRKAPRVQELHALIALLARCADPARLADVTGCRVPGRRGEAGTMPGEVKSAATRGERAA
jgi:hypothetical protein